MADPNPLLGEIETFLKRPGIHLSETGFGKAVMNDGKFISTLRKGRKLWPDTEQKVREFMAGEIAKLQASFSPGQDHREAAA